MSDWKFLFIKTSGQQNGIKHELKERQKHQESVNMCPLIFGSYLMTLWNIFGANHVLNAFY